MPVITETMESSYLLSQAKCVYPSAMHTMASKQTNMQKKLSVCRAFWAGPAAWAAKPFPRCFTCPKASSSLCISLPFNCLSCLQNLSCVRVGGFFSSPHHGTHKVWYTADFQSICNLSRKRQHTCTLPVSTAPWLTMPILYSS